MASETVEDVDLLGPATGDFRTWLDLAIVKGYKAPFAGFYHSDDGYKHGEPQPVYNLTHVNPWKVQATYGPVGVRHFMADFGDCDRPLFTEGWDNDFSD